MDRALAALGTAAGDPAVLPHRLHRFALGHGVELLVALPILAGLALGLWRMAGPAPSRRAARCEALAIALTLAACGVLIPIVLVAFGADYLAPRNLVAAMIPVTAAIAVLRRVARAGRRQAPGSRPRSRSPALIVVAFLAISIDIELSPRLQRGDWRGLAAALRVAPRERVITTVELGTAPLEYYLPGLHGVPAGRTVRVREIDETGYQPLVASAGAAPGAGLSPAIPRGHRRAHRIPLRLTRCATRQRGDAAPPRDHACKPRGTRAGGRLGVMVRAVSWERACATVV